MEYSDTLAEPRVLLPHRNWLARLDTATLAPRGAARCEPVEGHREADTDPVVYVDHCVEHEWPAPLLYTWRAQRPLQRLGPVSWMGSLAHQQRDASGQYYRRNRYYDPTTAQWTQEDPIGLAGGLNLYGFAAGDPVNFSDPFGLTPCWRLGLVCTAMRLAEKLMNFPELPEEPYPGRAEPVKPNETVGGRI